MKTGTIKITGVTPLLMHSDRLADPTDPNTIKHRELTSIHHSKKTVEIHWAIYKSQFLNGLYLDDKNRVVMPVQNVRKCLIEGARFNKNGKDIERGVFFGGLSVPLQYAGPKDPLAMWEKKEFRDIRSVVLGKGKKVMTCRPRFNEWACEVPFQYNETILNTSDLVMALENSGALVGLCDYRPLFGLFNGELTHD